MARKKPTARSSTSSGRKVQPKKSAGGSSETYLDSELVIALVGAVGTELPRIAALIESKLRRYNYSTENIRVSSNVIGKLLYPEETARLEKTKNNYRRIDAYMDLGNRARGKSKDSAVLAYGVANEIKLRRSAAGKIPGRNAYIISSLKHPHEVDRLREIYSRGFYLIGVHADDSRRREYLKNDLNMTDAQADALIERDKNEAEGHGQHTTDTFHLADFFVKIGNNEDRLKNDIGRILDLVFGHPFITPTFDEYAMFMAFSSALRSADLSRQVGAVIGSNEQVIAAGGNDVPQAGGGLYWPQRNKPTLKIEDVPGGRDHKVGFDSNHQQKERIADDILLKIDVFVQKGAKKSAVREAVLSSCLKDLTEYGRVVHAEMDAILSCARRGVPTNGATMYATTFPCHNCAKHIIAAGIKRVVYVEPYPKSKAIEFHSDSVQTSSASSQLNGKVVFEPFVGVGPRSFFNLFSMETGSGYRIQRKDKATGKATQWKENSGSPRRNLKATSYLDREDIAAWKIENFLKGANK